MSHFESWCRNSVLLTSADGDAQTTESINENIVARLQELLEQKRIVRGFERYIIYYRLSRLTNDVEDIKEKLSASDYVAKPEVKSANNNDR